MFKDTQEELERLEEELLAEEEPEELPEAEPEEWDFSQFDQDVFDQDEPTMIYPGGAHRFQQELDEAQRRPKSTPPVRARNTDRTDEDLEAYSDQVWDPDSGKDRGLTYLAILAVVLTAALVLVVAWWVLRFRGMLP